MQVAQAIGTRSHTESLRSIGFRTNPVMLAIAGFVVPYMAVYAPALMLQTDSVTAVVYIVFKALVAIGLWGAAAIGYLVGPLNWFERVWAVAAACFLVVALPLTDEIGLGAAALLVAWHLWRRRVLARRAASPA